MSRAGCEKSGGGRTTIRRLKRLLALLAAVTTLCGAAAFAQEQTITVYAAEHPVTADGAYTTLGDVAAYLTAFGCLPGNFVTKKEAAALGWDSGKGNLGRVAPGKAIGGDRFGNYEGLLPAAKGRTWTECDVDSDGGYRNGKRIVFSSDGLIYYTADHYNSFNRVTVVAAETPRGRRRP